MFSITCAQKVATIKSLPSELEEWERQRAQDASKLQRRRKEQASKIKIFPAGYGPDGRVPAYVEAHISSLKSSPFAKPVFSPGRCRPLSAAIHRNRVTTPSHSRLTTSVQVLRREMSSAPQHSRLRPATAPCETAHRRTHFSADRRKARNHGRNEKQLVGKMAALSGVQQGSEFRTVAALKTAVALKALEAQLRECRAGNPCTSQAPGGGEDSCKPSRTGSAPVSRNAHHGQHGQHARAVNRIQGSPGVRGTRVRRQNFQRGQRYIKPWNNRSPFFADDSTGYPAACVPSVLRKLVRHDPVFPHVTEAPPSSSPRRSTTVSDADQRHQNRPPTLTGHQDNGRNEGQVACCPFPDLNGCDAAAATVAPIAQQVRLQACFRSLTITSLVELNHLRDPPAPVVAVLAGLGCLLGWKQWRSVSDHNDRNAASHRPPRALFSNAYALRDVLASVCPRKIPSRRFAALKRKLAVPEAAPAKVRAANAAASVLLEWLLCVVACAQSTVGDGAQRG